MNATLKIGYASRYDPRDKKTWSGTSYYTLQQIRKYGTVEIFQYPMPKLLQEWLTTKKSINRRWFGKNSAVEFMRAYAAYFSRRLDRDLRRRPVDILFVSASPQLVAYSDTQIPIVYMTDATFRQLQGYYPGFSNLAGYNIREGIKLDQKAFQKSAHCMLASEWNRRSALEDYGIDPARISVVPCGANLDRIPGSLPQQSGDKKHTDLLFLGVEWERKGGAIALDAYRQLKSEGFSVRLKIIGCIPPEDLTADTGITVIPFLDKNREDQFEQLQRILLDTDFLLLPTRAECAGVVFSEASAYGIPSITTDTGGVSTYIKNGVNGYTLPFQATGRDYATRIKELLASPEKLGLMRKNCRTYYETALSWDLWGERFGAIVQDCLKETRLKS